MKLLNLPSKQTGSLHIAAVLLAVFMLVGAFVVYRIVTLQRAKPVPAQSTPAQSQQTIRGVSMSPKNYGAADIHAFYTEAAGLGAVMWNGDWTELASASSAPNAVVQLAKQYTYTPIVIVSTHQGANNSLQALRPLTPAIEQQFISTLTSFAAARKPPFLGIGNEVNRLHDQLPSDYATFKTWFQDAAKAVKRVSPNTKVFVTFQYEQMNGLYGGLFGGTNDPAKTGWQLLDDFMAADIVAFTTYPYLIYKTPGDVPGDYYTRIKLHTSKPVAFSEIGWPSSEEATGYAGTPEQQVAFMKLWNEQTVSQRPIFAIWSFLYDQPVAHPFASDGLRSSSGDAKPAVQLW